MTGSLRFWRCPDCGELHDKHDWPDNHRRPGEVVCAPAVISDIMPAIQSQGNGRWYDSKSEIRKHYRRDGLIEVGNDPARHRKVTPPDPDRKAIRESIRKAAARVERGDVREQTKALMLTRPGTKPPKHKHTDAGPPVPRGAFKPSFNA